MAAKVKSFNALARTETILLVEDQPEALAFTSAVLKSYGYDVLAAASGEDALELLQSKGEHVQLLLTDVVIPSVGGAQLAKRLTNIRPGVPDLLMSHYSNDISLPIDAQHTDFIQKPLVAQDLPAAVRELLGSRAAWPAHKLVADDEPGFDPSCGRCWSRITIRCAKRRMANKRCGIPPLIRWTLSLPIW